MMRAANPIDLRSAQARINALRRAGLLSPHDHDLLTRGLVALAPPARTARETAP